MPNISIISSSIRPDRKSHRVALYFRNYLGRTYHLAPELIDLKEYGFPIFSETFKTMKNPSDEVLDFVEKIKSSDGIIVVTPEYNGGYPASLKNVIDLLNEEWVHKPIGIVTVSAGPFGGAQGLTSLQFSLWKLKAWTIPAMFSVPDVGNTYDESGIPKDKEKTDGLAKVFIKELLWCVEADMAPAKHVEV